MYITIFWQFTGYYQPKQKSNKALVESNLWLLYDFINKHNNKIKSKVSVTMHFGNKKRNMKSNWNKEPQDSNITLRTGRGGNLGLGGGGRFNILETICRHFSYLSCFREI